MSTDLQQPASKLQNYLHVATAAMAVKMKDTELNPPIGTCSSINKEILQRNQSTTYVLDQSLFCCYGLSFAL